MSINESDNPSDLGPTPASVAETALMPLQFDDLRRSNVARCNDVFHPLESWSPTDWACAMAGECGEACNLVKKLRRGEDINPLEIGDELADIVIYADLLAARLGIDLGAAVISKFNQVSNKRQSGIRLNPFARDSRPIWRGESNLAAASNSG